MEGAMELRHLRYFIAVAEEGSLTLAAEKRLHTAQPSLSRQIRDLEYEVGVKLISRSVRGIELTAAGKAFLDHARLALTQAEAAAEAARRAAKPPRTLFAIGFLLDRIENLRLRFRQVAREIAQERSLAEASFIAVEDNPGGRRWRRKCLGQRRVILARIRRSRRHIDKSRHVRMHTGVCHDHSGEGMPDQDRRTILPREHALGRGYRFRQRCQWVLHGCGIEPRCLQSCNHLGPA